MDLVCCSERTRTSSRGLDLFCCAERARTSSRWQKNNFPEQQGPGSRTKFASNEEAPESGHPRPEGDARLQGSSTTSAGSINSSDNHEGSTTSSGDTSHKNNDHGGKPAPLFNGLSEHGTSRGSSVNGSLDPVCVFSLPPESEAASIASFRQLASQIRKDVRVLRRRSRTYTSLLPESSTRLLCVELRPGLGTGLEQWICSELAISDLEQDPLSLDSAATPKEPLVAVRLTRISTAKHVEKHDGGRSMRIRFKQPISHEVCEEFLEHSSPDYAKVCTEALVECIDLARALQGHSVQTRASDF